MLEYLKYKNKMRKIHLKRTVSGAGGVCVTLGGVMLRLRSCVFLSASLAIAGCSIHPLPDDVTRDTTLEIVNKIRCEARDALVERIMSVLAEPIGDSLEPSPKNLMVLQKMESPGGMSSDSICDLDIAEFEPETMDRFNVFATSSITYSFRFTISENKTKSGAATFNMPFTKGNFILGIGAGSDKTRQNERKITFGDTFSSLVTGRNSSGKRTGLFCEYVKKPRKHWIYPITGEIGLFEVVNTYIDLSKISSKIKTFSDTLTFTTAFNAGADPKVTLSSVVPKKLRLTEASASYKATRTDTHEVGLVLTTPVKTSPGKEIELTHVIVGEDRANNIPEIGIGVKNLPPHCQEKDRIACRANQKAQCTPGSPDIWKCVADKDKCRILEPKKVVIGKTKKMVTKPGFAPGIASEEITVNVYGQKASPFAISKDMEQKSLLQGLIESKNVDALDTSRQLKELIGK